MNLLVLSRQLAELAPFDDWLCESIRTSRLLTAQDRIPEYRNMPFSSIEGFGNYEHNALVEMAALRLSRNWRIDRIVATSESDILRAGWLRSLLGLPGQCAESAHAFRNKLEMKRRLCGRVEGLRIPHYQAVEHSCDVLQFVEQRGYPAIVKPVDGSGSEEVTVLRNEGDVEKLLGAGVRHGLEIESFIAGDLYHVDGLVIDGELIFCWPSKYMHDTLWFTTGGITASHMLDAANPLTTRLRAAAAEVLQILPTPNCTSFHLEVFHTPDDELYFCEIASRTGGGLINAMLEAAFGINLNRNFIRLQAGLPVDVQTLRHLAVAPRRLMGFGLIPPRPGVFMGATQEAPPFPWVHRHRWVLDEGKRSTGAHSATDRFAEYLLEFPAEVDATRRITEMWQWTTENAVWDEAIQSA